jgi:Recombination endonuclease VII
MKEATLRVRRWREKNRERQREADRRFRKRHLKEIRAKEREYYWANRKQELARSAEYARKNKDKIAKRARLKKHRMTQEEHDALMLKQQNRCAVCRKEFIKTPHIDHSHETKKNRGLLCDDCNLGLGRFKDSIEILGNAIQYLKEYQNASTSQS